MPRNADTEIPRLILEWYRTNKRDLPWRRTKDPYRIWVAEIMLQQTRVDTVIPYYKRFLKRFPDVRALARARPRETAYVEPFVGGVVPAQIYRRRKGNHAGKPSGRYKTVVLERAYRSGWEVYESLCRGTVDAAGNPLTFG